MDIATPLPDESAPIASDLGAGAPKTTDLVALGELLIDFTQAGTSPTGQALFERNPGGAPANVLVAAARLGLSTQFVGKVGADGLGDFLRATLEAEGVNTNGLLQDCEACTTLAFVEVDPNTGERSFTFARKPGADTLLHPDEVSLEALDTCRVLHVGSISLTNDPARSATMFAVREAADAGALISYDPNYRPALWPDAQTAIEEMTGPLGSADLLKLNHDEAHLVFGTADASEAANMALARGVRLVAITRGGEGAYLATHAAQVSVPACPSRSVDTTGAGDAFWGAVLAWLLHDRGVHTAADIDALGADDLTACANFACAAAACCVRGRGGMPAMPTRTQVEEQLAASSR
ncbi:MAG: carbohydrate kinase [Coriobacteriia bacterium]|nr:carbohydrate kinase [Coriobacteriia bacterium]MBS5477950.1 carbohydrate kinase [Coriobacteriia bacterium]